MNWVEPDNFPTEEFEFNTSHYSYEEGAKRQYDGDVYSNTRFYKLLDCPHCCTIIAVYNEPWNRNFLTYDSEFVHVPQCPHRCKCNFYVFRECYRKRQEKTYCVAYPSPKWVGRYDSFRSYIYVPLEPKICR